VFVDGDEYWDDRNPKFCDRILSDREIVLFPLLVKSGSLRVLFLNDAKNRKVPRSKFLNRCLPHGHNLSAASSPAGKVHQQNFLASIR